MALGPEDIPGLVRPTPLPTGFRYRPRAEVEGFELSPQVLEAVAQRFAQFDTYRVRAQRLPD